MMYQFSYAEVLDDNLQNSREREREALTRAIELLEIARAKGIRSPEAADGLYYVHKLWTVLIQDLANPENDLPAGLKAELISIGFWITREVDQIRCGKSSNFDGLIDICAIIRDGLR